MTKEFWTFRDARDPLQQVPALSGWGVGAEIYREGGSFHNRKLPGAIAVKPFSSTESTGSSGWPMKAAEASCSILETPEMLGERASSVLPSYLALADSQSRPK